jgi:hypothetical protein
VHFTLNGLSPEQLVAELAASRRRRKDIKEVWSQWSYAVNKKELADALWPVLKAKLDQHAPTRKSPFLRSLRSC